ncbi:MAG: hypothetical protein Q3983_04000 [Capnocytophaga sp.]|nr:hypothetical protein [Capnocytophaga sp.]
MKHFIVLLLFPFLAVAQPIINCKEVIKPYEDFQSPFENPYLRGGKNGKHTLRENSCYRLCQKDAIDRIMC